MDSPMVQLPLPLPRAARLGGVGDFLVGGSNEAALRWLEAPGEWPVGRLVLHGPAGCGKTHLARLWGGRAALWLDGPGLRAPTAALAATALVLDGADLAPPLALLHWINLAAGAGAMLLMTARSGPACFGAGLPDLVSRLRATLGVAIDPPEPMLLRALLTQALAARQLQVAAPVRAWLIDSLPPRADAIERAVRGLDEASLAHRAPIGRTLARRVLSEQGLA